MKEGARLSTLGAEMVAGLSAFCNALESGMPIKAHYAVRIVPRDPPRKGHSVEDVKPM
jgi:hypothetical protein